MWMPSSLVAMFTLAVTEYIPDECERYEPVHQYYNELGCLPSFADGSRCPVEYDCTAALGGRDMDKCYLNGNVYESGTIITGIDDAACVGSTCQCTEGDIDCQWTVECPQYEEELPEGCEDQYVMGECCPTGVRCFPAETSEAVAGGCHYGNETFALGQYIYQYEKLCSSCVCREGFDGTLNGPWCEHLECYYELFDADKIAHGCAPIVRQTPTCCTDEWRCPSDQDTVVAAPSNQLPSKSTCKFGELTLHVGDFLYRDDPCVVCTCGLPPHVTCFKKDECEDAVRPTEETAH